MILSTPTCDTLGCTKTHTASNGWWVVRVVDFYKELWKWEDAEAVGVLKGPKTFHFCGQTHALQFLSSEMGSKTDKPEEK